MDADQLRQEWDKHEQALIECAQRAWASEQGYELYGWYSFSMTAVVGYGTPPRAHNEYQHAFLFERADQAGAEYHLRTIGKAPWQREIYWRGTRLTAKNTHVRSYTAGTWTANTPGDTL